MFPNTSVTPEYWGNGRSIWLMVPRKLARGKLTPGMYAEVSWPVRRAARSLFVPRTAVKSTTERIFVIRVSDGKAEWVDVRRGTMSGELVEVFGDLKPGDKIVLRATDEIRPGTRITPRP